MQFFLCLVVFTYVHIYIGKRAEHFSVEHLIGLPQIDGDKTGLLIGGGGGGRYKNYFDFYKIHQGRNAQ